MLKAGIIVLSLIIAIAIPTKDTWSYKVMYDRQHTLQSDYIDKDDKPNRDRKK